MKKLVKTKEFGNVVAVEYKNPQHLGGSRYLALGKWIPKKTQVRIIVLEKTANRTHLIVESVNQ